jgi:hypothetical protein
VAYISVIPALRRMRGEGCKFNTSFTYKVRLCLQKVNLNHLHTHIYTYTHTHTHTYIYTYTHTYTHTHTYTYIYIHTHTYTHIYIYIHTHIHTHTHIAVLLCTLDYLSYTTGRDLDDSRHWSYQTQT